MDSVPSTGAPLTCQPLPSQSSWFPVALGIKSNISTQPSRSYPPFARIHTRLLSLLLARCCPMASCVRLPPSSAGLRPPHPAELVPASRAPSLTSRPDSVLCVIQSCCCTFHNCSFTCVTLWASPLDLKLHEGRSLSSFVCRLYRPGLAGAGT